MGGDLFRRRLSVGRREAHMITTVGRWTIEHDPGATAQCYSGLPFGPGCTCDNCKNFIAALDVALPSPFRSLAETFGIDVGKPAEIVHYCREDSGAHLFGGSFHIVGRICSGSDGWKPFGENGFVPDFESLAGVIEFGFTSTLALVPQIFEERGLVQLEFMALVPWVIPEQESE